MSFDEHYTEVSLGDNFADLLTRIDKIPLETIVEISDKFNCKQEFAGVIYLLNTNLDIDSKLILDDLKLLIYDSGW